MFINRKTQYCQVSILPSVIYRFNTIPNKIPASYFMDVDKLMLKFIWRGKRPRIANSILKENKVGRVTLSDFKTYYKATVIKTVWYRSMKRQINKAEW